MTKSNHSIRKSADILTLLGFLVGHRASVLRMIHARGVIVFAALLVATAALAREYDAVSLWHRPADLLGPFAASIILATGLFFWVAVCLAICGIEVRQKNRQYVSFLCGYWLTAPLAWLYAVPIESMADEITALKFNLMALSIVSIWRVLLFSRVVSLQFRVPYWFALPCILVPCMAVAFVGLLNSVMSLVSIMGGIRLTETQQMLVNYQQSVIAGIWWTSLPVLGVMIGAIVMMSKKGTRRVSPRAFPAIDKQLYVIPLIAALCFGFGLFVFQPRLYRAERIDRLLDDGKSRLAIELMIDTGENSLPITWDPPPRYPERQQSGPPVGDLLEAIDETNPPTWVIDRLLVQADDILLRQAGWWEGSERLVSDEDYLIYQSSEELDEVAEDFATLIRLKQHDEAAASHLNALLEAVQRSAEESRKRELERESGEK